MYYRFGRPLGYGRFYGGNRFIFPFLLGGLAGAAFARPYPYYYPPYPYYYY